MLSSGGSMNRKFAGVDFVTAPLPTSLVAVAVAASTCAAATGAKRATAEALADGICGVALVAMKRFDLAPWKLGALEGGFDAQGQWEAARFA